MATDTANRTSLEPHLGMLYRLRFKPSAPLSDELFAALAAANPDLRLERTAQGELVVMAPAGSESSNRNSELTYQLVRWSRTKGKGLGKVFDSSGGFILPNRATLSPDASWVSIERWDPLTSKQRKAFAPLCPDFVVEIRSESDSLADLRKKMKEYLAQGTRLGWLIDPLTGMVKIYRPERGVETLKRPAKLSGEEVLPGFVLDLKGILFE